MAFKKRFRSRDRDNRKTKFGGRSSFKYKRRSPESVAKRAKGSDDFDRFLKVRVPSYKPKEGDNTVRFVPPTWDADPAELHYGVDVYIHWNVGPNRGRYLCPKRMKGKACTLCDYAEEIQRDDAKAAKEISARKNILCYIVDRANEKEGVQTWLMPPSLDQEIALQSQDKRTKETLMIDDPDEGFDVDFYRKGNTVTNTKYSGAKIARNPSPLMDDPRTQEEILTFATEHPLPGILNFYKNSYLESVLNAGGDEEEEEEEDERPRRGRDRDEEEEADDEDEGEEDEEEETDEDEFDEDEEDEEDESERRKPKKRARRR